MSTKYFFHRKGWCFSTPTLADTNILNIFYNGRMFGKFDGNTKNSRRSFRIIKLL